MIFASMQVEKLLLPLLWQLVLIILAARIVGLLFRKIGQPEVVGEITAGLLLGPSLFGWLAPDTFQMIFRPTLEGFSDGTLHWVFVGISQIAEGIIYKHLQHIAVKIHLHTQTSSL